MGGEHDVDIKFRGQALKGCSACLMVAPELERMTEDMTQLTEDMTTVKSEVTEVNLCVQKIAKNGGSGKHGLKRDAAITVGSAGIIGVAVGVANYFKEIVELLKPIFGG